jgi:voltage-gated potassium channel
MTHTSRSRAAPEREGEGLAGRIDRLTALPMLLLALAYLPVFVVGYLPGVTAGVRNAATFAEYAIVATFAAELVVKVAVADRKLRYLRTHWLDVAIVLVPFMRPLRFLRVVRVLPVLARGVVGLRTVLGPYRGAYALVVGLVSVLVSAGVVAALERGAGGSIRGFGDALWWAATTITTVGYGDVAPVTPEGRAVAVFLMVVGIALFGMLTAGVAAYFVKGSEEPDGGVTTADLMAKLEALEKRIEDLGPERRQS